MATYFYCILSPQGPAQDFRLIMSSVHNNTGHGVNVQDLRSKMVVSNRTVIADNQFGAGIRVYRGAGEIIINGVCVILVDSLFLFKDKNCFLLFVIGLFFKKL